MSADPNQSIPQIPPPEGRGIDRLIAIMARLRDPAGGCPWDLAQSFGTIEVADAVERGDLADLKEELGDLLFHVAFYARLGEERGAFDFDAIAAAIADKMVRQHPHVFGSAAVEGVAGMTDRWEAQKATERAASEGRPPSVLDGVIAALPALTRALKLQKRAARVGFDILTGWRMNSAT